MNQVILKEEILVVYVDDSNINDVLNLDQIRINNNDKSKIFCKDESLDRIIKNIKDNGIYNLAYHGDKLLGHSLMFFHNNYLTLEYYCVIPDIDKSNVIGKLLDLQINYAKGVDAQFLKLKINKDSSFYGQINFLKQRGFSRDSYSDADSLNIYTFDITSL